MTERSYINDLARHFRATSVAVAKEHGEPKHLVECAVKERRKRAGAPDIVWCVFDADDHERLAEAMIQARDNSIPVALSNPCFELWAVLHFGSQTAYIDRAALRRKVQEHIPRYDKRLPFEALLPGYADAVTRAEQLGRMHSGNGSPEHENPSSGMWKLAKGIGELRTAP